MQSVTKNAASKAQYRRHAGAWRGFATQRDAFLVCRVRRHELISASLAAARRVHDKQVLFSAAQGTIGLIDCDTMALAEPALDLANLLVHLEFRREQGVLSTAAEQFASNAIHTTASAMAVPADRLQAYAASTRLRLACVYSFRPPYRSLAEDWARRVLDS